MDLLIKNKNETVFLSDLQIKVFNIDVSSPDLEVTQKNIRARSGFVTTNIKRVSKKVKVSAEIEANSKREMQEKRDRLYALLSSVEPFQITEYDFEGFGLYSFRDLTILTDQESERMKYSYPYHYKVYLDSVIEPELKNATENKLVYSIELSFTTSDLPFGESNEKTALVQHEKIQYMGTIACNQLESPFTLKATALSDGTNANFTVNDRTLTFTGTYKQGDVFEFNGVSNLQNAININDKTNYEYFILVPSFDYFNKVTTNKLDDFKLEVVNFKELYA